MIGLFWVLCIVWVLLSLLSQLGSVLAAFFDGILTLLKMLAISAFQLAAVSGRPSIRLSH